MTHSNGKHIPKAIDKQIHANELKLRILMTDGCTRNCSFCLNDFQQKPVNGKMKFLNPDTAKIAINQYASSFRGKYPLQVYFSGGEPTLHKELIDVMKFAKFRGCRTTLITNGEFPDYLEMPLKTYSDAVHFGTYEKSQKHAERISRMGGLVQCVYPPIDSSFIEFYSGYGLPIKVFKEFNDESHKYIDFIKETTEQFPKNNLSFRHTGIQENRGPGCNGCRKTCVTLKAAWIFPDGGSSPCPQLYKHSLSYPKTPEGWSKYFKDVEVFHRRNGIAVKPGK